MSRWKDWERECAKRFTEAGFPAERELRETREGNLGDLDIDGPFAAQCRDSGHRAPSAWRALTDALEAAGDGETAVALLRYRRGRGRRSKRVAVVLPRAAYRFGGLAIHCGTLKSPTFSAFTALNDADGNLAHARRNGFAPYVTVSRSNGDIDLIAAFHARDFFALIERQHNRKDG